MDGSRPKAPAMRYRSCLLVFSAVSARPLIVSGPLGGRQGEVSGLRRDVSVTSSIGSSAKDRTYVTTDLP